MFTWLPLYKEVATWILQYRNRQAELCNILREIGFEKNLTDEDHNGKIPLEVMDPITFFGYFQKPKSQENRKKYWSALIAREGFSSPIPADFEGLPSAQPMNLWMFRYKKNRKPGAMDELWDLAEQAIHGKLQEETFNAVLSSPGIGVAKLTQGIFWINPEQYYPIDAHKWSLGLPEELLEIKNFKDYTKALTAIKEKFKKPLYELSHDSWKLTQEAEAENDEEIESPNGNDSFGRRLNQYEPEKLAYYFDLIRRILLEFNIQADDKRIALTDRPRRITFIVGQRYCVNLHSVRANSFFRFISRTKLFPESEIFNGPVTAFLNRANDIETIQQYEGEIKAAIEVELKRSRKSPHLDVDVPEFRNIIFGTHLKTSPESHEILNYPSLNRILYGPPGTGKTYLSKRLALSILEDKTIDEINNLYKTPIEMSRQFERYQEAGQAAFTTFHQSFSYEDFIEGIKPDLDDEPVEPVVEKDESGNKIGYQIKPGIFKQIADRARSYKASTSSAIPGKIMTSLDLGDKQFFKMSLGNTQKDEDQEIYQYCISNNCIALGWGNNIDFTKGNSNEQIEALFEKNGGARSRYEITAIKCFRLWMNKGDIVLISEGNLQVRAIAQIDGDYYFDAKSPIGPKHFRKVKWLLKDVRVPVNELYEKQFSQQTIYMLWNEKIKKGFFNKPEVETIRNQKHVLIIDEINRGNVSAIFGELITLIEEDKREGKSEALVCMLPYSKKPFSVPDNLYIIGTMNTADRSVEALDTALRRRFVFEEMAPRYDLTALKKEVGGFQLKDILQTINKRLEKLLDKDHKIGHSYFMFQNDVDTRARVIESFYKNIIPLLQEYFFGDYGKIGLVLGKGFVKKNETSESLFGEFEYDGVEMLQSRPIYSIIDYRDPIEASQTEGTFESALKTLMNSVQ